MNDGEFINFNILPNHVTDIFLKLKSITSKLHNTTIVFVKKALFVDVYQNLQWLKDNSSMKWIV